MVGASQRDISSGSAEDHIAALKVIERLEVGPVRLENNRLLASYRVTENGRTDVTELIYRFEEQVFAPDDPEIINLADVISVQIAINYGLFCNEILFHGGFDRHDRRFIRKMAYITAREIFVKKFLEHNPFLSNSVSELPPIKRESYLQAQLIFTNKEVSTFHWSNRDQDGPITRAGNQTRYSVLSSGGKDSLLSFGLLKEMGYEVHPIFINESGRHWFTALNSYRYFSARIPHTARVWTNSDRVFNWMLRRLPFIRNDYHTIRSDEYPIRLWTVAVFLFGALPILKKKGIGALIIGDEFDTTNRLSHKGITHYDGLYDQSRYFDLALTRYFHSKGWGINQFSLLRPLSELLIEKILTERYPELQRHQASCHACHREGDRIHPCGRCEKCRRIIGMLSAIDADPRDCGYTQEQISRALGDLVEKGIHQEREGIEHLVYLLHGKSLIPIPSAGPVKGRERPRVMHLRFDPERSPVEGIPRELREPLYRIYLDYALGAVQRKGRNWLTFEVFSDPAVKRPFLFERPAGRGFCSHPSQREGEGKRRDYLLGELTWPVAKTRFREVDIALLPVGAIEQHGPHLPLDCDAFDAEYLALNVAERCGNPKPLVLPLIPYGVSYHHEDFAGTLSINPDSLSSLVYDIGMSAVRHGITKLVIINGHGGNSPALHFAAQMINRDAYIFTCVDTGETSDPDIYAIAETPNDVHAGEIETSTTLASRPHLVQGDKARRFIPKFSSRYLNFTSRRGVGWYAHTSKISRTGVLGDPTKGTREKGERMWNMMITHLVEFVEDLKNLSLDEIYQKRY